MKTYCERLWNEPTSFTLSPLKAECVLNPCALICRIENHVSLLGHIPAKSLSSFHTVEKKGGILLWVRTKWYFWYLMSPSVAWGSNCSSTFPLSPLIRLFFSGRLDSFADSSLLAVRCNIWPSAHKASSWLTQAQAINWLGWNKWRWAFLWLEDNKQSRAWATSSSWPRGQKTSRRWQQKTKSSQRSLLDCDWHGLVQRTHHCNQVHLFVSANSSAKHADLSGRITARKQKEFSAPVDESRWVDRPAHLLAWWHTTLSSLNTTPHPGFQHQQLFWEYSFYFLSLFPQYISPSGGGSILSASPETQ